jgi:hypothetical protein
MCVVSQHLIKVKSCTADALLRHQRESGINMVAFLNGRETFSPTCVLHMWAKNQQDVDYTLTWQVCFGVLQRVAVCCSLLQCVAVCCSVLQLQ